MQHSHFPLVLEEEGKDDWHLRDIIQKFVRLYALESDAYVEARISESS